MFHSPSSCASILKTCGRWRNCRSLKRECRLWPPQGRQCVRRNQISTKWFLRFILAHQNIQRQKPKYYQGFSSFIFAGFVPTPIWLRPQHWHATCVIHSEHTVLFPPDEFWKKHRLKAGECCIYIYIIIILFNYIWNSVWWFSLKAGWSQVLAVHADDASGILARSNGLSSQDKELCKEPTICCRYLFFGTPSEPTCWFFMRMKKLIVFRRFGSLGV